jgi:hypothetical protein
MLEIWGERERKSKAGIPVWWAQRLIAIAFTTRRTAFQAVGLGLITFDSSLYTFEGKSISVIKDRSSQWSHNSYFWKHT